MDFKIEIISNKSEKIYGLLSHWGRITIGSFTEKFVIPIEDWSLEQYKQQWKEAKEHLKTNTTSCFVTSVQNFTTKAPSIEMWCAYKTLHKIFFQNQLLINETVDNKHNLLKFNALNCYQFILPRISNKHDNPIDEEGNEISEWSIDLEKFEQ